MTPTVQLGGRTLSASRRKAAFFIAANGTERTIPMTILAGYLIVFLGGGVGAAIRHGVNMAGMKTVGLNFPYATIFINITGSIVMGLAAAYFAFKGAPSQHWRLFMTTGIL